MQNRISDKQKEVSIQLASEEIVTPDAVVGALIKADWAGAEALCRQSLRQGEDGVMLAHLAFSLRKQGRIEEALESYRRAVVMPEVSAEAWFNFGNLLAAQDEWIKAEKAFVEALKSRSDMVPALLQFARCASKRSDLKEAKARYERLLESDPGNFSGWLEAGNTARQMGNRELMLNCYNRCTQVAPGRWEGFVSFARALEETGDRQAAAAAIQKALAASTSKSDERNVYWILGKNRLERGDVHGAIESFRLAILSAGQEKPEVERNILAEIRIDLAQAMWRLGMDDALNEFRKASVATSEATLTRLAEVLFHNNHWEQALAVLSRCVELHPRSGTAHWNLSNGLNQSWRLEEALLELSRAEGLAPMPGAKAMRANIASKMGDADTALALYREIAKDEEPYSSVRCSAAMSALYSEHLSPEEVAHISRELFTSWGEGSRDQGSFQNKRDPDRQLKIGLVTADFHHQHPVNIFMQPLLRLLDKQSYRVSVYHVGATYDEQTRVAQSRVADWVPCAGWSDLRLARRIEDDGIDILLDLAGHTANQRGRLFARRAAPLQATFLGYPGSTGLPNMDWIIADPVVIAQSDDFLYSEQVARLPHTVFCYAPEEQYPYPAYCRMHAERVLTFGSFNNVPKITPKSVRLWSRIMRAIPESRLVLKAPSFGDEGASRRFAELFAECGIARQRIEFRGPVALDLMMEEYSDIDIALDTVPYNGGTTTHQALWMGVPVVVLAGGNFSSRMGASIMQAAGLPEWVAHDEDEYVEIAIRMSANRQALLNLKQGLRDRLLEASGWDIEGYAREFEKVLRDIWKAWCNGSTP